MLDRLLNKKSKIPLPKPTKEKKSKIVSTERFNGMVDYYTNELKSRIREIEDLKKQNEMLIKASLKSAARADETKLENSKLHEELRKFGADVKIK